MRHSYFSSMYRAICNTVHTTPAFVHSLFSYCFFLRALCNEVQDEINTLFYPERVKKKNQEHGENKIESFYEIVPLFFHTMFQKGSHLTPSPCHTGLTNSFHQPPFCTTRGHSQAPRPAAIAESHSWTPACAAQLSLFG